jgi:BlaI family transcriptional regulator, penicillinase repressor
LTTYDLTDLQLDVIRVLWNAHEATAVQVADALRDKRNLALTTVATILARLEKRGIVSHRNEGRVYIYSAAITEDEVRGTMLSRVAAAFEGDVAALINQLLNDRKLDTDEIARVQEMIDSHKRSIEGGE